MKNLLKTVAGLANYLDKKGHRDEAHAVDHLLLALSETKTLQVGGKVFTDAASAWRAYSGENYSQFVQALRASPGDLHTSEDVKRAIYAHFSTPLEQNSMPGETVEEGVDRPAGKDLKWWNPKDWDEYASEYIARKRKDAPIAGDSGVSGLGGTNMRGTFDEE